MESVFPAMSVARTWKVCGPSPSVGRMSGVMQGLYAPPSTEHSNVAPASFEEKPKVGVALELGSLGFAPIVVFGAIVSIWIVFVPTAGDVADVVLCDPLDRRRALGGDVERRARAGDLGAVR